MKLLQLFFFLSATCLAVWPCCCAGQESRVPPGNSDIDSLKNGYSLLSQNPDSSFALAKRILARAERNNHVQVKMNALALMAESAQQLGKYDVSTGYYLAAIDIADSLQLGDKLASFFNGLGSNFYYLGNLEKAADYLEQAANYKLLAGDRKYYSVIMVNLATIFHGQGQNERAMGILRNAEKELIQTGDDDRDYLLANLNNSMGSVQQVGFSRLDSALWYFENALTYSRASGDESAVVTALHNAGEVYTHLGRYAEALRYLEEAFEKGEQLGRPYLLLNLCRSLAFLYEKKGNYQRALEYKNRQVELREQLFEEETRLKVEQLETQFRTARKDEEIQRQQAQIARQELSAAKTRNRLTIIILASAVLLIFSGGVAVYFYQRKKARERLEDEKSRIYQNIVHDIRTPLSLITGPLHKLRSAAGNEAYQQEFEWIDRNARRLVQLVNELLELSRLDSGRFEPTAENGQPLEWLEQLTESFMPEAKEKQIELIFKAFSEDRQCLFAASAVAHIASNLISNAIKFSDHHGKVEVKAGFTPKGMLNLVVRDNGPGISEQAQLHVFKRFYRGDEASGIPGTGIGLSVVRELCELLGGEVTLKSTLGAGTVVSVVLPLVEASVNEVSVDEEDDQGKPVLLLVEDDRDMAAYTRGLLAAQFSVIHASNGVAGLKMAETHLPDIILTDVMMPEKDGVSMLRDIRNNELTSHIPALIFSAKTSLESRMKGFEAGALIYLSKPFHPNELLVQCQNLLNHVRQLQEKYHSSRKSGVSYEQRMANGEPYLEQVLKSISGSMDNSEYGVNELADEMCLSRSQLHRKIKSLTGCSAGQFIRMTRLERAHDLLKNKSHNVTEAADECGFSGQSVFTRAFSQYFGYPPSKLM